MRIAPILRVTGGLLMLFSVAQLVPIIVALIYNEATVTPFLAAFAISLFVGGVCWVSGRGEVELRSRDGFLITVLFYLGLCFTGAVPFLLAPSVGVKFTDGVFESLSGLTTTGATVLTGLDDLPRSVLLYRQLLQWLGGMGIIVLAVAVLPMLGVGGMQLYRAESPGPVKDTKLTPRIAQTAKALWYLYLGFTVACALAYWLGGMSPFDAICYSFSTVAIGGFAPHDASMGYFDSVAIESVAIVFMALSGMSFALHFMVLARRSLAPYARDSELRLYICALGAVAAIVVGVLLLDGMAPSQSIREGLFQAVSIATTTGYTTTDYSTWPMLAPVLMIFAAFAGGCAGSTAGGLKMYRVLLIYRQGIREIRRLIHPNGIFHIKLGEQLVPDRVVDAVWGFFAVYLIVFLTMVCILLGISDIDFLTAFSAVAANLNNLGPGLGEVSSNYQALPPATKWVLMLAMLLGRLEIFTLLVVLTPEYWRS